LSKELRIYLIRHGKPTARGSNFASYRAARKYIEAYDESGVERFDSAHLAHPLSGHRKIFCSTLTRARETAQVIANGEVEVISEALFRELERGIFGIPLIFMPVKFWMFLSRILYFLNISPKGVEKYREARLRIRTAAYLLQSEAEEHGVAVLVAHGLLNRFISSKLQKAGWKKTFDSGNSYLNVKVLTKQED
jgi:broad specificity phosphatase PhoE